MRRLLIRPGAIGDFILSLPALEFLKGDHTTVWCAESNVPLARFADHAQSIGSSGLDRVGVLPAADVLQRLSQFDQIDSWYGTRRAGFRDAVRSLPFRFYGALPTASSVHAVDFYCAQVGAPPVLPCLPMARLPEDFSVLHPFASRADKRWPLGHFSRLAGLLVQVQWCAGPTEELAGAVRIDDLYNLAQWLATARLYIGNDSGISHLAAAVGIPVIAVFGPTDPVIWAPRGRHVRVVQRLPMESIDPEEILALAKTLL